MKRLYLIVCLALCACSQYADAAPAAPSHESEVVRVREVPGPPNVMVVRATHRDTVATAWNQHPAPLPSDRPPGSGMPYPDPEPNPPPGMWMPLE